MQFFNFLILVNNDYLHHTDHRDEKQNVDCGAEVFMDVLILFSAIKTCYHCNQYTTSESESGLLPGISLWCIGA